MTFKIDSNKKKLYLIKLSAYCGSFFSLFVFVVFFIAIKLESLPILFPYVFTFLILFYFGIYLFFVNKRLSSATIESFDDRLVIKSPKREVEVLYSDIIEITRYPTIFDKSQLLLTCGKWRVVAVTSFFENFDQLENLLFNVKPLFNKHAPVRRVVEFFIFAGIMCGFFSVLFKNIPLSMTLLAIAFVACTFDVIRAILSKIKKTRKIVQIILYGYLAVCFAYAFFSYSKIVNKAAYRKTTSGTTVLMGLESKYKYDKNGNQIYLYEEGYEEFNKYDSENHLIYSKTQTSEVFYTYENGLLVEEKFNDGDFGKYEYDKNGNEILYQTQDGYTEWSTYDENNNLISSIDTNDFLCEFKYDEKNRVIWESYNGRIVTYDYDERGNCTMKASPEVFETMDYNFENKLIKKTVKHSDYTEVTEDIKYDNNGNQIYWTYSIYNNDGVELHSDEKFRKYDKYNNLIYEKIPYSGIIEYSYDYDKSGQVLRKYQYYVNME